ncbi:putative von Willebrand factor, type A, von Willebrand factor A-like domain superfamily [Helianthus annuus]|nr:putative von Willebrand factor, type A, von Willebrand factor A-like domain superfamily [Helianthus annuus]
MSTGDEFSRSVDMGLRLSKRIYYGKDGPATSAPKPPSMENSLSSSSSASSLRLPYNHHPTAPMVYAVITEPGVVDNPDIRSYQPYVYGRCNPPALIPLHMIGVVLKVECYLDTAVVTVDGVWRVHCLTSSALCDCRVVIPMGEQGSLLGVEVETTRRSYFTRLITPEDEQDMNGQETTKDGFLMKGNTYTFQVFQVEGGSNIHVKARWAQKMSYQGDGFCLCVPFTYPVHVFPVSKKVSCTEKILLDVNSGTYGAITCNIASHPLKEVKRRAGQLSFSYEAEVLKWSTQDFYFSYSVCANEIFGGLLVQPPSLNDYDQRDMFCFYIFPGVNQSMKAFKKEVVFIIDISGSMRDEPLEKTKYEVVGSLWKLNQGDMFNILASNGEIKSFSSSLEFATEETITNATEWMNANLIAHGGTNLMLPLEKAVDMVGKTSDSIPLIFLITDGAVEDERDICNTMKCRIGNGQLNSPRIHTFGIGSYCNHYFLQMLASIGRGYFDSALDVDSISIRMQKLFDNATAPLLSNVTLDALQNLESHEIFPFRLPDLLSGRPLIVSGRFKGEFPDIVKARGLLADFNTRVIDVKVMKAIDMPLEMVCARREIATLTAQAWLDQNTELEQKVAKMSLQRGIPSEYTLMILVQHENVKPAIESVSPEEKYTKSTNQKITYMTNLNVGFGNLIATIENLPPGIQELKLSEPGTMMKAASSCWTMFVDRFCCRCFIQTCAHMNDQCAVVLTQLCAALACFQCLSCCCDMCDSCAELCLDCL